MNKKQKTCISIRSKTMVDSVTLMEPFACVCVRGLLLGVYRDRQTIGQAKADAWRIWSNFYSYGPSFSLLADRALVPIYVTVRAPVWIGRIISLDIIWWTCRQLLFHSRHDRGVPRSKSSVVCEGFSAFWLEFW